MKKLQYLHPFLFAMIPAVFLWSYNRSEVFLLEAFVTVAVSLIFGGIVFVLCFLFLRNYHKAGILASALILFTLAYSYIEAAFYKVGTLVRPLLTVLPFTFSYKHILLYISIIVILVLAALGYVLLRTKQDLSNITKILSVVSGAFILISFFQIGMSFYFTHKTDSPAKIQEAFIEQMSEKVSMQQQSDLPDIYYIILDAYADPKLLNELLGYDDAYSIVNFLKEKEFFVVEKAMSNYSVTHQSLPSSLNMRHLSIADVQNEKLMGQMIKDNFLKEFLRIYDYRFIQFG